MFHIPFSLPFSAMPERFFPLSSCLDMTEEFPQVIVKMPE